MRLDGTAVPIVAIAIAFVVAVILTVLAIPLALKLGIMDEPNALKIHSKGIPRLGGLGVYGGLLAGSLTSGDFDAWVLTGASLMFIVGLIDDRLTISPLQKLVGQGIAGVPLFFSVLHEHRDSTGYFYAILGFCLVVILANAVNLLDGMDGLAGGNAFLMFVAFAALAFLHGMSGAVMLIIAAAILGFLPFNFPRAKIFMGDSGSLLIGFLLASALMQLLTGGFVYFLCGALIAIVPIFDLALGIVRRARAGKHIFSADRGHFYDRINHAIGNPTKTVLITYSWTGVASALAVGASLGGMPLVLATLIAVVLGLVLLSVSLGWLRTASS